MFFLLLAEDSPHSADVFAGEFNNSAYCVVAFHDVAALHSPDSRQAIGAAARLPASGRAQACGRSTNVCGEQGARLWLEVSAGKHREYLSICPVETCLLWRQLKGFPLEVTILHPSPCLQLCLGFDSGVELAYGGLAYVACCIVYMYYLNLPSKAWQIYLSELQAS